LILCMIATKHRLFNGKIDQYSQILLENDIGFLSKITHNTQHKNAVLFAKI
jgi:hypothetical protein